MTGLRDFSGAVEPLSGELPRVQFRWDAETEILSGALEHVEGARGLTGSIELEDAKGSIITLDLTGGVMRALEVVVWPSTKIVPGLTPPAAEREGRLIVPSRVSQPGIALLEVDVTLFAEWTPDQSVIHLQVGTRRRSEAVALADNLVLELDGSGELAGFWLLNVPPFPDTEGEQ
ncbi:MAG: hypothetical protein GTN62_13850 [Gemmatimonadales bacterium]|nr:hypothetical protein [Gemmatimonadales bacterium]NIN13087.1 hypothetical protein [Gemmatimonadales bacterium]NIN51171.1 hypothetical protein [Gemmatimonadales bacterium]NIP08635.1 hypothetical protein [Gemmatimonadales bacterium]NIR02323.1 hypothetical protein [Gemmatimonadales bacterium]